MKQYTPTQKGSKLYLFSIVLVAVVGGLLFGYDTAVINGAEKGLQAFFMQGDFGYTNFMHGLTCSSALLGCVLGSALSGLFARRLGRKRSLFVAGMCFFLSAAGSFYPEFLFFNRGEASVSLLVAFNLYRVLGGVGVGMASAICPMYIAEVSPSNMRGTLVSWNQFAIIFGQLVVYFVSYLIVGNHVIPVIERMADGVNVVTNAQEAAWSIGEGWRLMFVSECVPAGLFALLILLVPETPRHLAMCGRDDKALYVLSRINGLEKAREILSEIKATTAEKKERLFSYGYLVVFVGVMLSVFQQVVGINAVLYYSTTIFASMGIENPMSQTVMMGVVNILFTLIAIFTVERLGRKPLLITGSLGMALGAFGVALCNIVALPPVVCVVSIIFYSACFMFSWGPICWVLISEIFPNTIRGAAVAIAVAFQWIFNFVVSSTFVPMYNLELGSMGSNFGHLLAYGLYGVMCVVAAVFVWKLVPETKGKSLEEMNNLWEKI